MEHPDSEDDQDPCEENSYKDEENQCQQYTYQVDDFVPFPPFSKRKEDMTIKDVVKDRVLCLLPAKSLLRFRSVSKDWDHWIRNPFFSYQQSYLFQDLSGYFCQCEYDNPTFVTLDRAAYGVPMPSLGFLPGPVDVRSSSNGLILCKACTGNNAYYVCNPAKKEWAELPEPLYYHGYESAIVLAFEPSLLNMNAHYQVICAVRLLEQPIVCFELYSSQTKSWRRLDAICIELGDSSFMGDGFYMKGIAYWQTTARKVLAFDVKQAIDGTIPLPHGSPPGGILAKIDNELGYVGVSNYRGNECSVQIYSGANLSLERRIGIRLERGINEYRILPSIDSDVMMILGDYLIYSYRLSTGRTEVVGRVEDDLAEARFLPYVNSLVSVA